MIVAASASGGSTLRCLPSSRATRYTVHMIAARVTEGWQADTLAPTVNHCLDSYGPDRVIFGGDWPVCTLGAPFGAWAKALRKIISQRPEEEQRQLLAENAERIYNLD